MSFPDNPHILILPRWYPNRYDPMPGLFIRVQAEALAVHHDVTVLYVHPDPDCPNRTETEFSLENRVRVIRIYYRPGGNILTRWLRFVNANLAGIHLMRETPPDLVHVHVLTREGLMGWMIARRFKVPFVISEHWSRYFPENDHFKGWIKKQVTRMVVARAGAVMPVSKVLQQAMLNKGLRHPRYEIIPNVVDTARFDLGKEQKPVEKKQILHVSCFEDGSKNIRGLLDAVRMLAHRRNDFVLRLVGTGVDMEAMKNYAAGLDLNEEVVVFAGLKEGDDLVREYRQAWFTVLCSRFETFGTVIAESLACGTPVLSTPVGIAPEVLNHETGLLLADHLPDTLCSGLDEMLNRDPVPNSAACRKVVEERYSVDRVAALLREVYRSILQ